MIATGDESSELLVEVPFGVPRIEVGMPVTLEEMDGATVVYWDGSGRFKSEGGAAQPVAKSSETGRAAARARG